MKMTTESINKGNPLERTKCPVHMDELRRLYVNMQKSQQEIAIILLPQMPEGKPLYQSTVGEWLRKLYIPMRTKSESLKIDQQRQPHTPRKEPPVSGEMLYQLYWKEGRSLKEIGIHLSSVLSRSKPFSPQVVKRWIIRKGITVRGYTHAAKIKYIKFPVLKAQASDRLKGNNYSRTRIRSEEEKQRLRTIGKKGRRKQLETALKSHVQLKCSSPDCKTHFDRVKSRLNPNGMNFCTRICWNKYKGKQESLERLRTVKPNAEVDQQTKEWAERILGREVV